VQHHTRHYLARRCFLRGRVLHALLNDTAVLPDLSELGSNYSSEGERCSVDISPTTKKYSIGASMRILERIKRRAHARPPEARIRRLELLDLGVQHCDVACEVHEGLVLRRDGVSDGRLLASGPRGRGEFALDLLRRAV